ncbi:MAG: response regulator [Planctomycetota bacterium]
MPDFGLMIVDDDEADRYCLKRLLKAAGIEATVFEASDGREALDFLSDSDARAELGSTFPPAILFLDINMPRMNGFDFLKEFSRVRNDQFEEMAVLIVTSSHDTIDTKAANEFDFVRGYIEKQPRSSAELKAEIASYLPGN